MLMLRLWRWLLGTHISFGLVLRTQKCVSMTRVAGACYCSVCLSLPCHGASVACSLYTG